MSPSSSPWLGLKIWVPFRIPLCLSPPTPIQSIINLFGATFKVHTEETLCWHYLSSLIWIITASSLVSLLPSFFSITCSQNQQPKLRQNQIASLPRLNPSDGSRLARSESQAHPGHRHLRAPVPYNFLTSAPRSPLAGMLFPHVLAWSTSSSSSLCLDVTFPERHSLNTVRECKLQTCLIHQIPISAEVFSIALTTIWHAVYLLVYWLSISFV